MLRPAVATSDGWLRRRAKALLAVALVVLVLPLGLVPVLRVESSCIRATSSASPSHGPAPAVQMGAVLPPIRKIESVSEANVTKMTGAERKVTLKATGDLLLHQRKSEMTVELEAIFKFQGDKPQSVAIMTAKPFGVSLAAHDVHPRESFGKLAQKTLDLLAPKVAKEALVSIEPGPPSEKPACWK
jgi:hypothetical protein